jgi:hypothetical protein
MQVVLQPMPLEHLQEALLPGSTSPGGVEDGPGSTDHRDVQQARFPVEAGIVVAPQQLQQLPAATDANGTTQLQVGLPPLARKQSKEQRAQEAEQQRARLLEVSPDLVAVVGLEEATAMICSLQDIVSSVFESLLQGPGVGRDTLNGFGPAAAAAAAGEGCCPDLDLMLQQVLEKFAPQLQQPYGDEGLQQQQQGGADVDAAARSAAAAASSVAAAQAAAKMLVDGLLGEWQPTLSVYA